MILLSALVLGLLAGWGSARWHNRAYRAPEFRFIWLVVAAFLPQLIVAYLPATQHLLGDWPAAAALSASLVGFSLFAWINRRLPGMPVLIAGLVLNLLVIAANGGWMPISPDTASQVMGGKPIDPANLGSRFGQKDILLLPQDMRLPFLADRFLLPGWSPYQVAFSPGDVLVAIGAFWLLARPPADDGIAAE